MERELNMIIDNMTHFKPSESTYRLPTECLQTHQNNILIPEDLREIGRNVNISNFGLYKYLII